MTSPTDERRLQVLRQTELLDSSREIAFDRLGRMAAGLVGAPVALVSLVDENGSSLQERDRPPRAVGVAARDAAQPLNVIAYAGMPLVRASRRLFGSSTAAASSSSPSSS